MSVTNRGVRTYRRLARVLDTVGDGTGNTDAAQDFSGTAGVFKIAPASNEVFSISALRCAIADATAFAANDYGGINGGVTNGVVITVENSGGVLWQVNSLPIKTNFQWAVYSRDVVFNEFQGGGTEDFLIATIRFGEDPKLALRLDGSLGEFLAVTLNDNFSSLDGHIFGVGGWNTSVID